MAQLFPSIDSRIKFGILILSGASHARNPAEFVFFATNTSHLNDPNRRFSLSANDIFLLNPSTRTCPIFRSRRDAEITKTIYGRIPVFTCSGWKIDMRRLINQSDDSHKFESSPGKGCLSLYEGKYFHHYNHRWVTNEGGEDRSLTDAEYADPFRVIRPRHWYPEKDAIDRVGSSWNRSWLLAWRDITNATNERTFILSVVPSLAVPNTAKIIFVDESQVHIIPMLIANMNSLAFDFIARQKIGGTHMSSFIVEQLPILSPASYSAQLPWSSGMTVDSWLKPRVLELTYTAWDIEVFANDVGYAGPPLRWDIARRTLLRTEIDAAFFHLYGLSRDDTAYILDTFPIVKKNDEKAHGEYRTKRLILEIYDAMAQAARTGSSYVTRLDPPPADPRLAHPQRPPAPKGVG